MNGLNQPTVAAVIVTWNSSDYIEACLDSLLQQTYPLSTIFVVDNNSSDDTADLIAERYPSVTLVRRLVNEGFACGNNIAIAGTKSDWVLALNPDARIAPDFIEKLLNFAANDPYIGMMGGLLLRQPESSDDPPIIDSLGIEIFRSRRVRDAAMGERLPDGLDRAWRVFGICAAAVLYRREMLLDTAISGEIFPEMFFSYYEDADLSWRAWRRGWTAWTVSDAVGWHRRGGSPVGSRFSRYLTHRNRLWLIARNERLSGLWSAWWDILLHEILMKLRIVRYPYLFKAVLESIKGLKEARRAYRELPSTNLEDPPFQKGIGFGRKH